MEGDSTTIEFRNVSFAYLGSSEGSLKNIDLTIPDGQSVLPVSYTHLDVYKRQLLYSSLTSLFTFSVTA